MAHRLLLIRFLFALPLATGPGFAQVQWAVTTVAGSDWVGDRGPATQALLFQAEGVATDSAGNLYIAEAQGHRVRQVSPAGVIRTIAGTGQPGFSGDGGPADSAQLNAPYGLAFDNRGNLYIADLGNARVRRVAPDGSIASVASTPLVSPRNLAVDSGGNLYISDFDGQQIYKLGPDGALASFVGGLRYPTALAVDRSGALYIADSENRVVRKFDRGVLTPIAAAATPTGLAFDATGTLYIADSSSGQILKVPPAGGLFSTLPVSARDLAFGPDGSLYVSAGSPLQSLVERVLPGPARIVAGGGSTAYGDQGDARDARLNHPTGVAVDALGNIYIADRDNHRIRRVAPDGIITTIAGTGAPGSTGDNGPATLARLNGPSSVSLDAAGDLYIADTGNHRVREFAPGGIMQAVASTVSPVDAAVDAAGNVYIADAGTQWIYQALVTGVVAPFLGGLRSPGGITVDRDGNLYYTDTAAGRVWKRGASGIVTEQGAGQWVNPRGLAVSEAGDVFVADSGLGRILRVDSSGSVTPLAVDGTIGTPWDVAVGPGGMLYVADPVGNRVRALTPGQVAPVTSADAVNAASLTPGPLAPGMLVAILGTGKVAGAAATKVLFAGFPAAILAIDDSRILVQAPVQIAGMSQVQIEIRKEGVSTAVLSAAVSDVAPALFTSASGQAAAVNEDGTLNSADHPVSRGSWISLYGTGQGIGGLPVAVRIGGYSAEVLYSGAVAGYPGLFQINARVPAGYMAPGILGVVVTVGQSESPSGVSIAVQ
jgi:uncharacterized protein (TIGR03437 family)